MSADARGPSCDVEAWVDTVLDEYEMGGPVTAPLPSVINPNKADFNPQRLQDAMVWLHDGGLKPYEIAGVLHLPKQGIGKALARLAREYEDEDDE